MTEKQADDIISEEMKFNSKKFHINEDFCILKNDGGIGYDLEDAVDLLNQYYYLYQLYKSEVEELEEKNKLLEVASVMYHNLFLELQKQLDGVEKLSDLDSKDFEDLINLSKGNVFDEKYGWIHLPIKE